MTEEVNFHLDVAKEQMQEAISHLENVLGKIRAGKANPQMLRTVKVDYYGVLTPLAQAANVSTPDAQTIAVQPFDKGLIAEIEQAIVDANLGFNPSNNGEKVIINVPPLTEDRRRDLVKQAKVEIENAKVSVRNIRQKANDEMKKLGKDGLSEDMVRDAEASVQELTNTYSAKIDVVYTAKEAEIMTV
ncbi:MAG: ribosome recycling factor [Flavobacteriales bacterium]|jgi:ribosome recycling factor|nr:ribosome recycling factor [Flavobacteriales bacterium]MDG1348883.1 ribosome recycling factor [Flavobacteriales bacterium]|tara:strand:- start:644 stop:1207 length:564 start_codon:yes stop_codon:yes gene_type:complete